MYVHPLVPDQEVTKEERMDAKLHRAAPHGHVHLVLLHTSSLKRIPCEPFWQSNASSVPMCI